MSAKARAQGGPSQILEDIELIAEMEDICGKDVRLSDGVRRRQRAYVRRTWDMSWLVPCRIPCLREQLPAIQEELQKRAMAKQGGAREVCGHDGRRGSEDD